VSLPEDLSLPAVKMARRMQALPCGKLHLVAVVKLAKHLWLQFVLSGCGVKVEKLVDEERAQDA